ncbi:macrolide family glycosyltransferase [Dictyobacter formicarum]|uniref:Glycosyl transferase n=1 Tax=Dictyobacter formicarum TaxID=2778368 RepID=A0ABQ3V9J9_9CHLR|nr:macrolide family glycosyltransferase [Dictyobacter formicarum]GHO82464.1 glycosyl transferase [Dictyobacter formicarum]
MAKVLYFGVPQYGHIHPTLPLVRELIDHGEDVLYYLVTDQFKQLVEDTGATLKLYQRPPIQPGLSFSAMLVEHMSQMIAQLLEEVCAERPDYIVYDPYCTHARLLAQIIQVPAIIVIPHMFYNEHVIHQLDQNLMRGILQLFAENEMNDFQMALEPLCAKYHLQTFSLPSIKTHAEPLNISFIPRELQPAEKTFDEHFLFVGSSIAPRKGEPAITLPQHTDLPVLYISLGTIMNNWKEFYLACFEAFDGLPIQVIIAIGPKVSQDTLGTIPENISLYPFVPQLEVLSQCNAFITHGGTNSVVEALYYGVPLVVLPLASEDEFVNAKRVQDLMLGLAIEKPHVSASSLRESAMQVLHERKYKEQALLMSDKIKVAGGYRAAAAAILNHVSQK